MRRLVKDLRECGYYGRCAAEDMAIRRKKIEGFNRPNYLLDKWLEAIRGKNSGKYILGSMAAGSATAGAVSLLAVPDLFCVGVSAGFFTPFVYTLGLAVYGVINQLREKDVHIEANLRREARDIGDNKKLESFLEGGR
jgi:hypothetical protein